MGCAATNKLNQTNEERVLFLLSNERKFFILLKESITAYHIFNRSVS